ncbi:MAG: hypothetical protein LC713_04570 [Actinobacteria bacterium]|nr:hypothetical protein [Actinomycetota bacterium]
MRDGLRGIRLARAGMRGVKVKRIGRRLGQALGVLVLAAAGLLVANEILGSDDQAAGPPPLRVRTLAPGTFASSHPFAPYYVVPSKRVRSPAKLSRTATSRFVTRPEAALAKGALAGSPQVVRLELRSTTDDPVTVDGVSFDVVSDARPLRGWFTAQPACSFERVPVARLNLDSRRARPRYIDADGKGSRELALELDRSTPVMLELQAATRSRRVAWRATLSVSRDGGPSQTLSVDDSGSPFRVTSVRSSRGYAPTFGATGISGFSRVRSWDRRGVSGC